MSSTFNPAVRRSLQSGVLRDQFPIGEMRETVLGEICPTAWKNFPFYFLLPYDNPIAMLQWRLYVRERCVHDLAFRASIWEMCKYDVAFFAVTFAVIFEPRPLPRWLPFHLWTDQVSLLSWFTEIYGRRSGAVNKTRGIGLSWLSALFIFHKWLFSNECKIAVLTKDKDLLDSPDANSLIGKFQYLFDNLPVWAKFTQSGRSKLRRLEGKHTFINVETGAVIQGFVSTSTKLRQLRFTMIFADEFAFYNRTDQEEWVVSAGGCTNCMLMVSTWNDFDDMFHYILYEEESSLLKMHAFWWNNHERWQGAYKMDCGQVTLVDKDYRHTPDYPFGQPDVMDEGLLRSPWVDAELLQPGKKRNILKALRDIYGMSVCEQTNSFFDNNTKAAVKETIVEPDVQGTLDTSKNKIDILPTHKSDIRIWGTTPDGEGKYDFKDGPYTAFCDLSHGVEAAFSVLCVLDKFGNQVLEYGTNSTGITEFAFNVVMLARCIAGREGDGWVVIDFEQNGLPKAFVTELKRLGYGRVHMSEYKSAKSKPSPAGEVPKFAGTRNTDAGLANFREFERAVMAMDTRVRSQLVSGDLRLCGKDQDKGGQPKFPKGLKEGHGDFLHAYAGAWWRARTTVAVDSIDDISDNIGELRNRNPWDIPQSRWSTSWAA